MADRKDWSTIRQGGKTTGKVRVTPLGEKRGFQVEHHDGRVEAVVRPAPLRGKLSISGRDE